MQNNSAFQDAVARAQQVAQKLAATAPNTGNSLKRLNSDEDSSKKRPALESPTHSGSVPAPVLRAQQIAQKINSQLGVKKTNDPPMPLSNQTTFQEEYKIPDKFVGLIIGKGGEQIVRLQAESGCKVQINQTRPEPVPGGPNPPDRLATLCGSKDSIERAKRIMDEIIARGRMAESGGSAGLNPYSMGGGNAKSIDVMLPSSKCGLVIGKGGENIKRVSEEFNVKMYVVQDSADVDGVEHKPLRIMGDPDRVERARQYVLDSLAKSGGLNNSSNRASSNHGGSSSYGDPNSRTGGGPVTGPCNEAIYHVPYEKAGIIIGKGGESIKEINRRSGAFVELDKAYTPAVGNSNDRLFKLRGTPEQIVTAQQLMYDKVANSPGGLGDMLSPVQFQQQFNLPVVGGNTIDSWSSSDQYGTNANSSNDPYAQWANAYGQWPQMNFYDQNGSNKGSSSAAQGADASAMGQMDPNWMAYYQQMSYYTMMQANMSSSATSDTSTSNTSTKPTDSTATTTSTTSTTSQATNSASGQPDYSQQWIEYYRSVGQNDAAEEIARHMKTAASSNVTTASTTNTPSTNAATSAAQAPTMMTNSNSWVAYAQQWANAATQNNANGNKS